MENPGKLTLAQEFHLKVLHEQVASLNVEQSREYLLEAMRQLMIKDNWVKHTFKKCYLKL